jgi:hypothetical protein
MSCGKGDENAGADFTEASAPTAAKFLRKVRRAESFAPGAEFWFDIDAFLTAQWRFGKRRCGKLKTRPKECA